MGRQIKKEAHMEWTVNIINTLVTYWNSQLFVTKCAAHTIQFLIRRERNCIYMYIYAVFPL